MPFADIRGYTSFAEGRAPQAIFSAINRYTETVSRVVHERGGAVVEFNGDGMMAVFGAPRELPGKEVAAVAAARDIVAGVRELRFDDGSQVDAGVGVATGEAYVGTVRAVDRRIWSALGNTTNLAARLQALTRDLDASIAIDEPTFRAAGPESSGFKRHAAQSVRGRTRPLDLFSLPLAAPLRGAAGGES